VQITNRGQVPVFVQLGQRDAWLTPGASTTLTIRGGDKELVSYVTGQHGQMHVIERLDLFISHEHSTRLIVADTPIRGTIRVTNPRSVAARVYIDGVQASIIGPQSSTNLMANPGKTKVMVVSFDGHILYDARIDVPRGSSTPVTLVSLPVTHHPTTLCRR